MKKTYGLLGRNIEYSFSRKYFNERFENEAINALYKNFDLQEISELTETLKNETINGMNVTIPYKQEIMPFLDRLSPDAKAIGAVNVVKFEKDSSLTGYNSDYYGFSESLKPLLKIKPKKALILGTGGASKAIAYALKNLDIDFIFVSRTSKKDQLTYSDLNQEIIEEHLLIINSTPLGTFPNVDAFPDIPYQFITPEHMLFDLIYNPTTTVFLKKGATQGASILNGERMLVLQAEKSWEIWNS